MKSIYEKPFHESIDRIKSVIDDGDLCILLLAMIGIAVFVNSIF